MRVRARQDKRREEEGGVRGSVREAVRFFFSPLSRLGLADETGAIGEGERLV